MGSNYYWNHSNRGDTRSWLDKFKREEELPWRAPLKPDYKDATETDFAHVCKLSAGGAYCFDCNQTLVVKFGDKTEVLDACPKCGTTWTLEDYWAKCRTERPYTGVGMCTHVSWAQDPETVKKICRRLGNRSALLTGESDLQFTGATFLEYLERYVRSESTDGIGYIFS
jgi:hypothetical protein